MSFTTNYLKTPNSPLISTGVISLSVQLNDYPRLTIVQYGVDLSPNKLGNTVTFKGMPFILDSSSVRKIPKNAKLNKNFTDERTDTYVHAIKKVFEKKIKIGGNKSVIRRDLSTTTSDFYSLSGLSIGGIQSISGKVKVDKEQEEITTTLRDLYTNQLKIQGKVWTFAGASLNFKVLGSGFANIKQSDFVSDINVSTNAVPTYKNTEITWEDEPLPDKNFKDIKLVRIDDDSYYTYEGDSNPHIRPPTNQIPRDLSANSDMGGITKEFRIINYKYGQPIEEIEGVFGFAHAAIELVADPLRANGEISFFLDAISGDASESSIALYDVANALVGKNLGYLQVNLANNMTWRLISAKKKTYIYETVPISIGKPFIKKEDGSIEPVTVPDEYEEFLSNQTIEVLVAEETKGWELRRFKTEEAKNWTNGSIAAWLELDSIKKNAQLLEEVDPSRFRFLIFAAKCKLEQYLWRKIPLYERSVYAIGSYSNYYKDAGEVKWDVQYIPRNQLKEFSSTGDDTEIPVLFPDVNWVPDLMVIGKTRFKSSIATMGNPDWIPFVGNYYEQNPTTITSGSEEFESINYCILPSVNTKPEVTTLIDNIVNIDALIAAASSSESAPGTLYAPHNYMAMSDYGIPGVEPPSITVEKIGGFPDESSNPVDRFVTYATIKSSSGEGIKNNSTSARTTLAEGRPPAATLRKPGYTTEINDETLVPTNNENTVTKITSNITNPTGEFIDSYSLSGATSLGQVIQAAKFDLEMSQIESNTLSGSIKFTKAEALNLGALCGSSVNLPEIPGGKGIVKGATYTIQYLDGKAFIQPLELEVGFYEQVELNNSYSTKKVRTYEPQQPDENAIAELLLDINLGTLDTASMNPGELYSRWV